MALIGAAAGRGRDLASALHNPFQRTLCCRMGQFYVAVAVLLFVAVDASRPAHGRDIPATPDDYAMRLRDLRPGDRLLLEPGIYTQGLRLHGVNGTSEAPILIRGPSGDVPALFLARSGTNTISLRDVSHIVIQSLHLEGLQRNADAVKAESESRYAHHITLARLRITGHDAGQDIVGINIQSPAWDWVIRDCEILGAGTGMYLGRSDGTAGLVGAVIERNVIRDTLGYNLQIKHQIRRPNAPGMPSGRRLVIVRHNVFSKSAPAGAHARPNMLVGHFPAAGPGSEDMHVIYGNVFHENPAEALLQGEGNIALYNNVFVSSTGFAIRIQPHNGRPRWLAIFNNTILARGPGLSIHGVEPGFTPVVLGNAVFSADRNRGWASAGNLSLRWEDAGRYLRAPYAQPPVLDLSATVPLLPTVAGLPEALRGLPGAEADLTGAMRYGSLGGAFVPGGPSRRIGLTAPPFMPR